MIPIRIQRELDTPVTPPGNEETAPVGTQLARGFTKGVTAGLYEPFADAGIGGWPETIGNLAGGGLAFIPFARAGGLGVAAASKLLPSLIREVPAAGDVAAHLLPAGEAASRMFQAGRQIGPTFTGKGAAAALGLGGLAQAGVEQLGDESRGEHKTFPQELMNVGMAAGFGALGGAMLARHASQALTAAAEGARNAGADVAKQGGALLKSGKDYNAAMAQSYQMIENLERVRDNPDLPRATRKQAIKDIANEYKKQASYGRERAEREGVAGTVPVKPEEEGQPANRLLEPATPAATPEIAAQQASQAIRGQLAAPAAAAEPSMIGRGVTYRDEVLGREPEGFAPPTGLYRGDEEMSPLLRRQAFAPPPPPPGPTTGEMMERFAASPETPKVPWSGQVGTVPPEVGPPKAPEGFQGNPALGRDLVEAPGAAQGPSGPPVPLGIDERDPVTGKKLFPGGREKIARAWASKQDFQDLMEGEQGPKVMEKLTQAATVAKKPLPEFVAGMSDDEVLARLSSLGYTPLSGIEPQQAKNMLADELDRIGSRALPPVDPFKRLWGPEQEVTKTVPFESSMKPTATGGPVKFPGVTYEDPQSGRKIFRGPVFEPSVGPGASILDTKKFEIVNPVDLAKKTKNALKLGGKLPPGVEPEQIDRAVIMLRNAEGHFLPQREQLLARLADDMPLGLPNQICEPGSPADAACVTHFLNTGFAPEARSFMDFWERHGLAWIKRVGTGVLPATWILAGTGAERLPGALSRAESWIDEIRRTAKNELLPIYQWSDDTKKTMMRLFHKYSSQDWPAFQEAVMREAPEAREGTDLLREFMSNIWREYVADGVLEPEQRFVNYFPVVRQALEVQTSGIRLVERGDNWIPVQMRNIISGFDPQFAKKRVWNGPEDFPRQASFDDTLNLYISQYARHKAIRQEMPEINRLMEQVPEEYQNYVAGHVNAWLGHPDFVSPASAWNRNMRELQFARTIGWNVLSPVTNTLQRLNTFALVRNKAFVQAFADARDPERLALIREAGLGADLLDRGHTLLDKMGIDEAPAGPIRKAMDYFKMGAWFSKSEQNNRVHAFLAGVREAEYRGITDPAERIAMGRQLINETQFIQTPANMPAAFRSGGGKLLGQFQTFRLNQLHFMARLIDEAGQGIATGDFQRTLPFLKFAIPSIMLGGLTGVMPSDYAEEQFTRAVFGKAMHIGGIPELLFGVSLGSQLGMGSIGMNDVSSFLYFLPGPSLGYVQGLLGWSTGYAFGKGLDMSGIGRELSSEERMRMLTQSLPAGIQANRALQALRLVQTNGEYRQALDVNEFLGLPGHPASGDLLSKRAADLEQMLGTALGMPAAFREQDYQALKHEADIKQAYSAAEKKAATLYAAGKTSDAMQVMKDFSDTWMKGQPTPLQPSAIKSAVKRRFLPPGERMRAPRDLTDADEFKPKESLFGEPVL